ncbi:MAG: 1,2-phenylacetyl-CoA epoxidase subunit PaaE [Flavitalea sp.]
MAIHFHPLQILEVRKETNDCVSVAFDVPEELQKTFEFRQGQNLTVKTNINGEEIRRSYSICSCPLDKELRIAIKKVPGGLFSEWANQHLKAGETIEVLPPTGKFFTPLDPANTKKYLAVAAGSGITPVLSIIKTTLLTEPGSSFTLLYGNRNRGSIIFREELEALKNRFINRLSIIHVLSREMMDTPVNSGRIDSDKILQLKDRVINFQEIDEVFLCGPEAMILSVSSALELMGMPKNKIHFELFHTPGMTLARQQNSEELIESGSISKVTVRLDGIAFSFDLGYASQSILDAALDNGADLPYACKGGVCSTCKAKITEGEVSMVSNYALEQDEIDAGFVLTCQAHPRTEKVTIDFDVR